MNKKQYNNNGENNCYGFQSFVVVLLHGFTVVVDLFLFMFSIKSVMIHTCYFYVAETMLYATLMYAVFITNK
jgi:hypothetical protein